MKVTQEIHEMSVEALELNRRIKDDLECLEMQNDGEEIPINAVHIILIDARALTAKVQEISNRVAGYAAPRSGE